MSDAGVKDGGKENVVRCMTRRLIQPDNAIYLLIDQVGDLISSSNNRGKAR